jgi:hypothetical protein
VTLLRWLSDPLKLRAGEQVALKNQGYIPNHTKLVIYPHHISFYGDFLKWGLPNHPSHEISLVSKPMVFGISPFNETSICIYIYNPLKWWVLSPIQSDKSASDQLTPPDSGQSCACTAPWLDWVQPHGAFFFQVKQWEKRELPSGYLT